MSFLAGEHASNPGRRSFRLKEGSGPLEYLCTSEYPHSRSILSTSLFSVPLLLGHLNSSSLSIPHLAAASTLGILHLLDVEIFQALFMIF